MKTLQGIKMSFQLQEVIQDTSQGPIRGVRTAEQPSSLNNFIYTHSSGQIATIDEQYSLPYFTCLMTRK